MFGRKSRGQVIGEELSEGFSHVRIAANEATKAAAEALAPRVEAARGAMTPRVEAARDALTPRVEAARDALAPRVEATREAISKGLDSAREQAEDRFAIAREQADNRRAEIVEAGRRSATKTAKRAKKNAKRAKKSAVGARKDAKAAIADAKAQAKSAAKSARPGTTKKRRRWPWVLALIGVVGAVVAKGRGKSDDDLWGAPSDSPVHGYTEDPHPNGSSATPATDDPYPGTTADSDGTIAEKIDDYKDLAPDTDGPLHGKLADSAHETGTEVGDSPQAQEETWSEMIDATKENDDAGNAEEAAKHAATEGKPAAKKSKDS